MIVNLVMRRRIAQRVYVYLASRSIINLLEVQVRIYLFIRNNALRKKGIPLTWSTVPKEWRTLQRWEKSPCATVWSRIYVSLEDNVCGT